MKRGLRSKRTAPPLPVNQPNSLMMALTTGTRVRTWSIKRAKRVPLLTVGPLAACGWKRRAYSVSSPTRRCSIRGLFSAARHANLVQIGQGIDEAIRLHGLRQFAQLAKRIDLRLSANRRALRQGRDGKSL